jgi:hypothetical protein
MTDVTTVTAAGWLSRAEMDAARERLPILYVDVVAVRVDDQGTVTKVGGTGGTDNGGLLHDLGASTDRRAALIRQRGRQQ